MKGTVKFYNEGKGFGFIAAEDGKEYFVHQTGLSEGVVLRENDSVSFEVVDGDRGPKAENVSLEGSEASEAPAEEAQEEVQEEAE
jgi:cold shock protein